VQHEGPLSALLMALRVKGAADEKDLRNASRISQSECDAAIASLTAEGLVRKHERLKKYVLTDLGNKAVAAETEKIRQDVGQAELEELYSRFMVLDAEFKRLASAWQVSAPGPPPLFNDHSDPRYDQRIINNLVRLHHRLRVLLEPLGKKCQRYSSYGARFADSLNKLSDGSLDHFTNPRVDSCHNIWFELHEDLLCTLGRQRSE
jgi:DNA-binding MarR family transcriptional regulator